MSSGRVLPGPDPPVQAEIVHESERTRITRLVPARADGYPQGAAGAGRGTPGAA